MPTPLLTRLDDQYRGAVSTMRALVDAADAESREMTGEEQTTFDKVSADLDGLRQRMESILQGEERMAAAGELEERAARVSTPVGTPVASALVVPSDADRIRAICRGEARGASFEARVLTEGTASAGGNVVPTSFWHTLQEFLRENSAILAAGPTILHTASGEALQVPKVTSYGSAVIVGEGAAIPAADPAFGQVTLNAYKFGQLIQLSTELVQDSGVDLLSFIARSAGQNIANAFGTYAVTGTGTAQPQGVVVGATLGKTGAAAVVGVPAADDLIDLFYSVIYPYRNSSSCAWLMRDATLAAVRKLKTTTNEYLWEPALTLGAPETLLGKPIYTDPNVAATALSAKSVLFGDFSQYWVRMVNSVRFERSDEYAFANDLITFRVLLRMDSRLIDTTGAIKYFIGNAA